jgi:hypothetical protein
MKIRHFAAWAADAAALLRALDGGAGRGRLDATGNGQKKRAGGVYRAPAQPSGLSPPETVDILMTRFAPVEKRKNASFRASAARLLCSCEMRGNPPDSWPIFRAFQGRAGSAGRMPHF